MTGSTSPAEKALIDQTITFLSFAMLRTDFAARLSEMPLAHSAVATHKGEIT
jgi:hypothetical protein